MAERLIGDCRPTRPIRSHTSAAGAAALAPRSSLSSSYLGTNRDVRRVVFDVGSPALDVVESLKDLSQELFHPLQRVNYGGDCIVDLIHAAKVSGELVAFFSWLVPGWLWSAMTWRTSPDNAQAVGSLSFV